MHYIPFRTNEEISAGLVVPSSNVFHLAKVKQGKSVVWQRNRTNFLKYSSVINFILCVGIDHIGLPI